jgi:RNA polymerase sigma factor for flagellar operon FliA
VSQESVETTDPARFLEVHLPLVDSVVTAIARRHRVRGDALDEFRSLSFLKLVEHDYDVLRRFQGASSLRTYLTIVLQRVLLDHRNREWGRWRASAAAHRIGPAAVMLERLVTRDGLSPDEALAAVGAAPASECADFARGLAPRPTARGARATLGEEAIPDCQDPSLDPEARMERREQIERSETVRDVVREALRSLPTQDHLLLTLRYRDGLSIADVARVLEVEAKPLYRRIDRLLAYLQEVLCTDELAGELARQLARQPWCDAVPAGESGWWRQSIRVNGSTPGTVDLGPGRLPRRRSARRVHRRPRPLAVRRDRTASL